ncbi:MAG: tRNA (adenosine(37)-N6)-dimethylallyltransferase MiaA [Nitrospirae bacterium CG18_big_fil_WC_8_21_14_2_50_70_55]|nr:tRNA (adenosine(37)-N6)-dimethylallyltransferase MiaA [Deltaproteobacteria bacterium]PIQ05966.1 MAG: tRNA (adenosine(37)-N6)-dimethylallyltransferase MiaA [Nitrospirae bacterium CG18_big_fil_WC_8_21_14_2_50_70_55]PIU79650.1 MAG: tRNA (adenosine(37)-N6)-dimethylallyltransferase MiaA [Nitrospirae bacterium CG06_land_8_20_14_3_00_70_43]PIW83409.1 MAG: tRNA (adenosine(37)-N6)-dimethylallyltransferase MiaA [Nitrospirae bacterium CG_4_8_14_3_um_filter_70_85]PIX82643.1 MAG: tRNA (adenosine(37)-N6)-
MDARLPPADPRGVAEGAPAAVGAPLLVIAGPTGVGKSAVAVAVARAVGGEVVGADSMQVYRGMDIGTGKLRPEERGGVPHHMLDVWEVEERGSAGRFLREARAAIAAIHRRGRLPILCGGTGLYLRAVVDGLAEGTGRDPGVEARIEQRLARVGAEPLHAELARLDPAAAGRIPATDRFRLVRALGVCLATGRPFTAVQAEATRGGGYRTCYLCLTWPRPALYARIDARVEQMFRAGLVAEVAGLAARLGPTARLAIGYRECLALLAGELDEAAAKVAIQHATRRYAKRQLTWFRAVAGVRFIDLAAAGASEALVAAAGDLVGR